MDLGLDGRVALVTGGSRGIGRGIAEALASEGTRVAITSRDAASAERAAAEIGDQVKGYAFDSGDLAAIDPLIDTINNDFDAIDIYVANTGGPPMSPDPLSFTDAQWEAAHRTLVVSPMAILRRVLPPMRDRGWGRVLAVSSSVAREPLPGLQLSAANRPGLLAAFKHLAHENARHGVTFNAVLPGRIATERIAPNPEALEHAQEAARTGVPAGRLGEVREIAAAAAFLVSAPASYVTGQSLLVDGGVTRSW